MQDVNVSSKDDQLNDLLCEELYKSVLLFIANDTWRQQYVPDAPIVWKTLDSVDVIKVVACTIIVIGGLLGNILVILTIALNKSMRNSFNFYLANLAVTDAIICVLCMGNFALGEMTHGAFLLGPIMCKLQFSAQMTCLTVSVLTLSAISCDRFMAIMFPLRARITTNRSPVVLMIIWIVSFAVSIPLIIVSKLMGVKVPTCIEIWPMKSSYDESLQTCIIDSSERRIYFLVISFILFFLPILIMITSYSLILRRLSTSEAPGEQHASNANAHARSRKKVNKMVFVIIVVFAICWAPLQILILYGAFRKFHDKEPQWIQPMNWFSFYIAFANSFMNPIIYTGFSEDFREAFCNVLRCGYKKGRHGKRAGPQNFNLREA